MIDRIVSRVGRRIDESSPMVDARLKDGSRVNAIIPPLVIDLENAHGERFTRRDFSGRVTLVNFWASWCPHCNQILPELKEIYKKYHKSFPQQHLMDWSQPIHILPNNNLGLHQL